MNQTKVDKDILKFLMPLYAEYGELSNGDKAVLRRAVEPDDLQLLPAFYRLIQDVSAHFQDEEKSVARKFYTKNLSQIARLVFFLPYVQHQANAKSLGGLLKENGISERRLFLVMRSQYPEDLKHLRRLCQQFKGEKIDGENMARVLFYWGREQHGSERSKRGLMRDFYLFHQEHAEEAANAGH